MTLAAGTRLGPYEIVASIGAGGMGEVYRARDTRLERTVAVKVLNSSLVASPELKARFEREAKVVSQLQHPNICVLHDIGSDNGTDFLVMEFLDGESLAERLKKGPLPAQELLKIAIAIADALEKAHREGVVHRDLKPGNVMLTKAGAKLLDFGLAKPFAAGASAGPASSSSIFAAALTQTSPAPLSSVGAIMGTVQYMSPEQIQGCEADARSDVFAFGVMLYEMTTGKRAFDGKTQASIVGSILANDPPPVSTVRPDAKPGLERAIRICLEKDPEERFQTAHDLKLELQRIAESPEGASQSVVNHRRPWLPWALAAVLAVAAIVIVIAYEQLGRTPKSSLQASILPPPNSQFVFLSGFAGPAIISRDGTRIAFVATKPDSNDQMIWVQSLSQGAAQPLAGTEGAMYPFWSYDGRYLGFFAAGKLQKIDANGGPPQVLCDAIEGRGGAWNQDDVIVFAPRTSSALLRVTASGGTPVAATDVDAKAGEVGHRWPQFLPDSNHFIFWVQGPEEAMFVGSLDSKQHKMLVPTESSAIYSDPGYLLFMRDNILFAQKLNRRKLELEGDATPIVSNIAVNTGTFRSIFTASSTGTLLYLGGSENSAHFLAWYGRDGRRLGPVIAEKAVYRDPALSPDGKRLAVSIKGSGNSQDIWVIDLQRQTKTRLTFGPSRAASPVWSPDGKWIYYRIFVQANTSSIVRRASDGTGTEETVLSIPGFTAVPASLSPDGKYLAYLQGDQKYFASRFDVWALPLFGDRKPFPLVTSPANEIGPQFSPDGKWLAYMSNESGPYEIYIRPFPGPGGKYQVSNGGAVIPQWRADGRELFFKDANVQLMAVDVHENGAALELGTPHTILKTEMAMLSEGPFVPAADGKRFLINEAGGHETTPLTVVTNWTELLKK